MNVKRVIGILVIVLIIFAIISSPSGTANMFSEIGAFLRHAATAIISFFQQLF